MKIKEECGVTDNSLGNAKMLIKMFGIPEKIILTYIPDPWEYLVKAEWSNSSFIFTGMSWGYTGEGSRGLYEFIKMCKGNTSMEEIARLDQNITNHVIFRK